MASPTKDQYVEAKVLDEMGHDQGTIILKIKRIYSPGELGRFVLADLLSASDSYYRAWAESKQGRPSTVDGSYHFCRGDPASCPAGKKEDLIVHVGKWRGWKEEELLSQIPDGYDKEAQAMLTRYFKKEGLTRGGGSAAAPGLSILRKPTGPPKTKPGEPEIPKEKEAKKRLTALETELEKLKKDVTPAEDEKEKPKRKGRSREPGRELKTPRKKKSFEGGLLPMKKAKGDGGDEEPSDSSGGSEDDSEDSSSEPKPSDGSVDWGGESSHEKVDKKRKKKKKKDRGKKSRSSDDDKKGGKKDKDEKKPSKDEKKKKKKLKKKKKKKRRGSDKSGKRGSEKTEKDKGPFGMGETRRMVKDDEEESESGSETSGSSQSFRKAPSGLTLHLRLQRYAMRHPGRLATRLLQRMEKVCRLGGAVMKTGVKANHVRPCAVAYFLTILTPSLKDRWSPRTQRELRVLVEVLDHLAESESGKAAHILAQRIKALEQSVQDNNNWKKAKYLELIEADETTLADRGEVNMMQKEVELEEKFRGKGQWRPWENPKGKGKTKDEGPKGGKGPKGKKTPAQEAAEKKDH